MKPPSENIQVITRRYRLPLRRYIGFRVLFDRLSPKAAEEAFYNDLEEQGSEQVDSEGEPTVTIKGFTFEQVVSGGSPRDSAASSGAASGSGAAAFMSPAGKRPRMSEVSVDEVARGGGGSAEGNAGKSSDATSAKSGAKAKAGNPKIPPVRRLASEDILACGAGADPAHAAAAAAAASSNPQVEMLKARSELQKSTKAFLEEITSARSPVQTMMKRTKDLKPEQVDLLEMDHRSIIEGFETTVLKPARELDGKMVKCPLRDVQSKRVAAMETPCHIVPPDQKLGRPSRIFNFCSTPGALSGRRRQSTWLPSFAIEWHSLHVVVCILESWTLFLSDSYSVVLHHPCAARTWFCCGGRRCRSRLNTIQARGDDMSLFRLGSLGIQPLD